jgi:hypothetical protein
VCNKLIRRYAKRKRETYLFEIKLGNSKDKRSMSSGEVQLPAEHKYRPEAVEVSNRKIWALHISSMCTSAIDPILECTETSSGWNFGSPKYMDDIKIWN